MPKFKPYNYNQNAMVVINYKDQLQPGTFEHAIHFLIENKLDLSSLINITAMTMVAVLLTMLRGVRLDVHQHRNDLGVGTKDVRLDPTRDGVAFGDRGAFGDLQMEIHLKAVA